MYPKVQNLGVFSIFSFEEHKILLKSGDFPTIIIIIIIIIIVIIIICLFICLFFIYLSIYLFIFYLFIFWEGSVAVGNTTFLFLGPNLPVLFQAAKKTILSI